ncbi:hypothetical protein DNTS_017705 [Danionella cerebrum]|uniref:Uncharacterized protein n=1 Tax=Danionella cerebrum TaxID=2873325 RepID=A0A553RQD9_9TELE|nr:hypothetical protein DNTS_017705 [Danionella translucida]
MDKFTADFNSSLQKQVRGLKKVHSIDECEFILHLFPIASRAGTDIDAAIRTVDQGAGSKPAVLGVLFPTNDPDKSIQDSNNSINRENTFAVDCVFNEDRDFMKCKRNKESLQKAAAHITSKLKAINKNPPGLKKENL